MAERCRHLGRVLAGEEGMALVFAIQVLAILTVLIAAVMASSLALNDTTERDYNSKSALAAALSGLDVARYRLAKVNPTDTSCMTSTAVSTGSGGAAAGECPAYAGDLGNGTTYGYYVTPALTSGTCAGQTITAGTSTNRCITAYGTSNGVTRRAQALIRRAQVATSLFPFNGILGLSSIAINESSHGSVTMDLRGCTGTLSGSTTFAPGPTAAMSSSCAGTPTTLAPRSTAWTLPSLDTMYAGTETVNDNATIFGSASGFDYTASGRVLTDKSNATLIINGANPRTGSGGIWTFNFCTVQLNHVTQFKLQNGAAARFLFDSNQRSGSGCPGPASVSMTNISGMNYDTATDTAGDPTKLQFMYYGTGTLSITNQQGMSAALYAPQATLDVVNQTKWVGAIAANVITGVNGLDFLAGDVSSITIPGASTSSPWVRTTPGFVECRSSASTAGDPESGC
jgi:Tfp pilus assembly protein PilX